MTVADEILALTKQWMRIVGSDVHKDRDCHFYIEKRWSYGQEPVYEVGHEGYIWDEVVSETFSTSTAAERFLRDKLREMVSVESAA